MVDPDDAFAAAIGHVMLNAARAERLMSVLTMRLGFHFTNPMPGATWSTLLREAIRLSEGLPDGTRSDRQSDALRRVRPTVDEAGELMELRNLLAHGGWFIDEDGDEPVLQIWVERKSGERFERWPVTRIAQIAADLDSAADAIGWLANELRELGADIPSNPASS